MRHKKNSKKFKIGNQMSIIEALIFTVSISTGCYAQTEIIKIREEISDKLKSKCNTISIMSTSGQVSKGFNCIIDGISYDYIINNSTNKVERIISNDDNLKIEHGISKNSLYRDIKKYETSKVYIKGWGYVVDIGLLWKCVFWDEEIQKKGKLHDDSQIKFFIQEK